MRKSLPLILLAIFASLASLQAQSNSSSRPPAAAMQDTLWISPAKPEPGVPTVYRLGMVLSRPIPARAVFELVFPPAFDLSMVEVAGSSGMKGGLQVRRQDGKIMLTRTGLGKEVPPGKEVILKVGLIRNPQDWDSSYTVQVVIRETRDDQALLIRDINVRR